MSNAILLESTSVNNDGDGATAAMDTVTPAVVVFFLLGVVIISFVYSFVSLLVTLQMTTVHAVE